MIPQHFLKRIRRVKLRTRRLAEEHLTGAYRSVFKGRGMDFEDVRVYSAGDDVRFIDWNVTARMDTPHVKVFKEERELSVIVLVDLSGSAGTGSGEQTKRELAAEVAACLAFSAVANGDKVGLVLFSDRTEKYLPPGKGRNQVLRIIREVLLCQPARRGTSLKHALNFVNHIRRRRAIVFLLSDFLDDGFDRQLKVTSRRHDLIPILLADARERTLPDAGWIVVDDAETGETVELNTGDPKIRATFAAAAQQRVGSLRHRCRRAGTDLIELSTDEPYLGPIHRYLQKRLSQRLLA
jgi:uncharacterized protein (DUF58 family)